MLGANLDLWSIKPGHGGAISAATSTFSPADAAINGYILSNNNLSASGISWWAERGTTSKSSGKFYVEFKFTAGTPDANDMIGFANAGFPIVSGNYLGSTGQSIGFQFIGAINHSGSFTQAQTYAPITVALNDVAALAVDLTAGKIWLAYKNVWQGGGDPVAGTLPNATFAIGTTGALFYGVSIDGADTWTVQPDAAHQTYPLPSGFTPWG